MKHFYFACSKQTNNKRYAWVVRVPENQNILARIEPDAPDILHPCTTKKEAVRIVNHWNACYIANGVYLFENPGMMPEPEPETQTPLRVCARCLEAIESREGRQFTRPIYFYDDEPARCEWCEEEGFEELYEFL